MAKTPYHVVDKGGGKGFILLPRTLLESEAFRSLSFRAQAALIQLQLRFNGFNNGRVAMSSRALAEALGSKSPRQNLAALAELEAHGFIALAKDYPKVQRKAREYRLTYISHGAEGAVQPATNDYLTRSCKKSPVSTVQADQPETPNLSNLAASTSLTHITNQSGGISPGPVNPTETAGGHFRAEPIKPQSMTGERWDMAVRRARENPAAPDAEPLRAKAADAIARIGRGTQRRIANAAGLSEPVMSKFMRGTTDLDGGQRIRIAQSIPALFAHRSDAA